MRVAYVWPSGQLVGSRNVLGFHGTDPAASIRTPSNAGDMFVTEASLALTRPEKVDFLDPKSATSKTIDRINAETDFVFVRGANTLADQIYAEILADFLEKIHVPVVTMGIGIQAPAPGRMPRSPAVQRLAKVLSDKCKMIGVRGEITRDFLSKLGVTNVQVIGCPSLLRHNDAHLQITKPAWSDLKSFGFSLTRYGSDLYQRDRHTFLDVQARLIKELHALGRVGLITQVEQEEKAYAYRDAEAMAAACKTLREKRWFDAAMEEIYRTRSVFFGARPSDYDMHVRNFDVIFGTRLHANAMATACSIPAITLSFDLRVQEIYEYWQLPVFTVEAAKELPVQELYERADFEAFNAHSTFIYTNFRDYLDNNGVSHCMTAS